MHLTNEVVLAAAPEHLFELINDVQRVAPCMPGAALEGSSGEDAYQGRVKIKVGPISAAYSGTVRFLEVDRANHRLVLDAKGSDQHGGGNAEAKVEVRIRPHEDGSVLALDTDLVVRGKVAQFGRGALGDVSQKLMEQFARNLGELLAEQPAATGPADSGTQPPSEAPGAGTPSAATVAPSTQPAETELNGLSLVARPLIKRFAPAAAALAVGLVAGRLSRRVRRGPARNVLADEIRTATVHIGSERFSVPARRVTSLCSRR